MIAALAEDKTHTGGLGYVFELTWSGRSLARPDNGSLCAGMVHSLVRFPPGPQCRSVRGPGSAGLAPGQSPDPSCLLTAESVDHVRLPADQTGWHTGNVTSAGEEGVHLASLTCD